MRLADEKLTLGGLRVLVVDDDAAAREMLFFALGSYGAQVTVAASAEEALAAVAREVPDVLVSDISLPDVDGYDLIRSVRALDGKRSRRVPAVAVSGWAGTEDRVRAIDSGFQVYLSKPVAIDTLVEVIAGLAGARYADVTATGRDATLEQMADSTGGELS